jgi:hypothetical protein
MIPPAFGRFSAISGFNDIERPQWVNRHTPAMVGLRMPRAVDLNRSREI